MNCKQVEDVMLGFGLNKYEMSEGTNFQFIKNGKHKVILERLRPMANGGIRGFLYVELLNEYKDCCSKNGHISIRQIKNEFELRQIVDRILNSL